MNFPSFATAIIEFAIGNMAIALPLGLLAWWLQRRGRQPFLAHLLWLVVLIKLVTPPLVTLRLSAPSENLADGIGNSFLLPSGEFIGPIVDPSWFSILSWPIAAAALWLAGSTIVLIWTLIRAFRFDRLLGVTSETAAQAYQQVASRVGRTLGLNKSAAIFVTAANVSPMVWWVGGAVRIYIPRSIIQSMDDAELSDILAHELGHIKRGDCYVRWLECLVCIALWWNPIAWWARRNLRACEEICCDAFVLSKTKASRDAYAGALVSAMELLAAPTMRPAALASHVNGGFLERRIKMILSGQTVLETPRWLRRLVIAAAVVLLPLGFTFAQDSEDDLEKARQWLDSGVNSAFLTQDQADIMLRALVASEHRYGARVIAGASFVGDDGNVIELNRNFGEAGENVRIIAERLIGNAESGEITLYNGQIEIEQEIDIAGDGVTAIAVPIQLRDEIQLGDEIDGRRVVRVQAVSVDENGDTVSNVRVIREFDGETLISEIIQPAEVE